jgi:hypothetical protein
MREDSEVHSGTGFPRVRQIVLCHRSPPPPGRSSGIHMKKQTVRHPDQFCGSHPTVRVRHRPWVCLEQCRAVVGHPRAGPSLAGPLLAGPLLAGPLLAATISCTSERTGRREPAQRRPRRGLGWPILLGQSCSANPGRPQSRPPVPSSRCRGFPSVCTVRLAPSLPPSFKRGSLKPSRPATRRHVLPQPEMERAPLGRRAERTESKSRRKDREHSARNREWPFSAQPGEHARKIKHVITEHQCHYDQVPAKNTQRHAHRTSHPNPAQALARAFLLRHIIERM